MAESYKHKQLKQVALRWLQGTGCVAFACEISFPFMIVDACGVKSNGDVYVVESKISNSDFKSDFKPHGFNQMSKIQHFEMGRSIDFIYYIVGDNVDISMLPRFIGLLDESGRVKRNARRQLRVKTDKTKLDTFTKIAKACSWRAYGHVIRHEQEQLEFSLI